MEGNYHVPDAFRYALNSFTRAIADVPELLAKNLERHELVRRAIADTLEGVEGIEPELFDQQMNHAAGSNAAHVFAQIDSVLILACGTS